MEISRSSVKQLIAESDERDKHIRRLEALLDLVTDEVIRLQGELINLKGDDGHG